MRFAPHHRMVVAAFFLDFAVSCGLVATPFFAYEHLKAGPGLTGAVGAVQMALYALGCLVSARFMTGRSSGLGWAFLGVGVFALFFCFVPFTRNPTVFGFFACVPFLGLALAWPAMQAWIGGEPDAGARGRHLSAFNIATAFGFTVSPLVAGPLYDLDYRTPFVPLLLLCAAVVWLLMSLPVGAARAGGERPDEDPDSSQSSVPVSLGLLYASWCATLTANGLVTAVRSVFPKRIEFLTSTGQLTLVGDFRPTWLDSIGAATSFSWLAFLLSLGTVVCFMILGRTSAWHRRHGWIVAGQAIAAVSFVWIGYTHSLAVLMFCFVLVGANFGLCFFSSLYYSLAVSSEKHRRAAINEGALGAGGFIGGVGVGYLAEWVGVSDAFRWTPVALCAAIFVQVLLLQRIRQDSGSPARP